jgi:ATP-dependent DNA helicase RecG
MAKIVGTQKPSAEADMAALVKAIDFEIRAYYSDFQGRHTTFSRFMYTTSDRLLRRLPHSSIWMTVRSLFRTYPNVDVATRISIIRRVQELIAEARSISQGISGAPDRLLYKGTASEIRAVRGLGEIGGAAITDAQMAAGLAGESPLLGLAGSGVQDETQGAPGGFEEELGENVGWQGAMEGGSEPDLYGAASSSLSSGAQEAGATQVKASSQGAATSLASLSTATSPLTSSSSSSKTSGKAAATPVKEQQPRKPVEHPEDVQIQFVKGVGPKMASVLANLNIATVDDLLRHYPRKHLDFQNRQYIRDLNVGEEVSIFGTIRSVGAFQSKKGNMSILTVVITDGTGAITITKFVGGKGNKYLLDRLKAQYPKGAQVLASGVVEQDDYSHKLKLKNPEVEILSLEGGDQLSAGYKDQDGEPLVDSLMAMSIHAGRLVPVYALTEGLSLRYLRNIIHTALKAYSSYIDDALPEIMREKLGLMPLAEAFANIHFPETAEKKDLARRRLVFDELFSIQLQMAHRRYQYESREDALSIAYEHSSDGYVAQLRESLPFKLTGAQERVFNEIVRDLASPKPLHRLVQGDVGSGKTIVALLSLLVAIENGFQGAMMAPTEILAEQHFRQFQRLLAPLGLKCVSVLGKQGVRERKAVRQELLSGQAHIAVGTHALIEDDVEFKNLGLIIIDEQHRFGVKQRAKLKTKSASPELLTMTATPIPRTMALTMHGDLDVSEIDELPPGRKPIETALLKPSGKKKMWEFVRKEILKGRQAYVVFPLIDESESLSAKAATAEFEKLSTGEFKDFRLGLMHGKLKAQEKDEVMEAFRKGEYHILVSTTVIEVGVDVPNSSVMVIENADRFGLAQLHQLRGRVGRGAEQSYCFLVSEQKSATTVDRLSVLVDTTDGFVVAEKDLELRGPGEFLGYRQSGLPDLLLADLVKDAKILEEARNAAIAIMRQDPELKEFPRLRKLVERKATGEHAQMMRSG